MSVVVSDAGPIRYLVVTGLVEILEKLYGHVIIPSGVAKELQHDNTPAAVVDWIRNPPSWVEIKAVEPFKPGRKLGIGECEAMQCALDARCLLIVDDLPARKVAYRLGIPVTGTVGTVVRASKQGYANGPEALKRLQETNIYLSPEVRKWLSSPEGQI